MDDFIEDRVRSGCPDKWLWLGVMGTEVFHDGSFECCDAREGPTAYAAPCDFCEETFDLVQPTRAGRRKVQFEARVCGEPAPHGRRLMRSVVVEDKMNREMLGHLRIDATQKAQELLMPVPPVTDTNNFSRRDVQRRKERSDSVTGVVVRLPLGYSGSHRKNRLRSIQRLNLRLFVDAEHDGALGRSHIETNDVSDLLDKERVGRKLEGLGSMWLQSEGLPNAMDRCRREPRRGGHFAHAPVRRTFGASRERLGHDLIHAIVGDLPGRSRARSVAEALQPSDAKTLAPLAYSLRADANALRDSIVRQTAIAVQQNPRSLSQPLRRFWPTRPALQRRALGIGHVQIAKRTTHVSA